VLAGQESILVAAREVFCRQQYLVEANEEGHKLLGWTFHLLHVATPLVQHERVHTL
jgi:hypothetical protein